MNATLISYNKNDVSCRGYIRKLKIYDAVSSSTWEYIQNAKSKNKLFGILLVK